MNYPTLQRSGIRESAIAVGIPLLRHIESHLLVQGTENGRDFVHAVLHQEILEFTGTRVRGPTKDDDTLVVPLKKRLQQRQLTNASRALKRTYSCTFPKLVTGGRLACAG
ncbi:hypothetical protein A3H77_01355 [Candidatus Kaiserbacteria bacterium RIFCSPLOWO2_02_FULL_56_11]|uniref:Uncharacterized protein n=1 Tax=Candidatus Kaiserbacteria bacterium RIFCSPHIGHO2_02_FULL_56_30 TaxID=1798499 RepID=A0A1F6E4N3_9BACT|nr:MAG: hypothetical protein A3C95_02255 [Candidatus Kaiserbacteria bacterium RIFCSPHIGHO2_02_FULL_56_30]OGG82390.1 MAG: hypothetical protein A3H77_01355 [Candidatus Kaiserbacteria bacterium RIFCSPLOWO2_02_FULL_56_11]